jgi:hypothetical protein
VQVTQTSVRIDFNEQETEILPAYPLDTATWKTGLNSGLFTLTGPNTATVDVTGERWKQLLKPELLMGAPSGQTITYVAPPDNPLPVSGLVWHCMLDQWQPLPRPINLLNLLLQLSESWVCRLTPTHPPTHRAFSG